MIERPAQVGERFWFGHPDEPQFNCELTVTQVHGNGPDDLVFFNDGTHSKQKNLVGVPRMDETDEWVGEVVKVDWLRRIETLRPGDACEFHYPARAQWLAGTVVVNGGSGYWEVRDETDVEGCRGKVASGLYIEQVRLPGQTEAWPR
jgi:hypothetical protein